MNLPVVAMIFIFFAGMVVGIPLVWTIGLSCVAAIAIDPNLSFVIIPQKIFYYCDSFALLAVPCFFLAGDVMTEGGLSRRLVNLSDALFGWVRGGISICSIVACMFFAAISGSSVATTAAIGSIMHPEMVKKGYPEDYSAAIQAAGGTLGIIIPPSIVFVVYGTITGTSIGRLLVAGIIPGIIAGVALCGYAYWTAKKNNYPVNSGFSMKIFLKSFKNAMWALTMPILILGGIYSGIFTPTESSAIAALYGIIVCVAVYRQLTFKALWQLFKKTAAATSSLMILVSVALVFGYLITYYRIPYYVAEMFVSIAKDRYVFMFIVVVLLVICGMFIDVAASNLILGPILAPVAVSFGISPVHFGMVFVFILALGQATPPFGTCLFVASSVCNCSAVKVSKRVIPFCLVLIGCALIFAYVPALSTFLPNYIR